MPAEKWGFRTRFSGLGRGSPITSAAALALAARAACLLLLHLCAGLKEATLPAKQADLWGIRAPVGGPERAICALSILAFWLQRGASELSCIAAAVLCPAQCRSLARQQTACTGIAAC